MAILIIENSREDLEQLTFLLNMGGHFELVKAKSVSDAFKHLGIVGSKQKNPEKDFDLIIIDIFMKGMNGIEACKRIKAFKQLEDIPVIVVTENIKMENMLAAFEVGVFDYITKPLENKIELIPRVNSALKLKAEMEARKAREKDLMKMTGLLDDANKKLLHAVNKLKELASVDGLTGVVNRRYFDAFLSREWKIAIRNKTPLSIFIADIDYFKPYNDIYGHQKGDECLKEFATALKSSIKRPADIVARYGGEEFVIVLPETGEEGAIIMGKMLRDGVEKMKMPHKGSKVSKYLTFSMGIAITVPTVGSKPESLIELADKALYQAKDKGRNRFIVHR